MSFKLNVENSDNCFKILLALNNKNIYIRISTGAIFLYHEDVCKAGWSYFNGVCHLTSRKCATWAEAQKACKEQGANLITIRNQEDNVYVQNKHNGGGTWLGLSDMAKDGEFCWISDEKSNFTFWKKGDLESPFSADCAFALGAPARYKWCHDSCSLCHNYTCGSGA